MGVATLSLLVEDELRPTHLPKAGKGCSTQSRAWTSHGMPVLQAIFHAETKPNYNNLFQACCELWTARHPNKQPLEKQMSLQLHKDFHPSIEEARHEVWQLSRARAMIFPFQTKVTHDDAGKVSATHIAEGEVHQKAFVLCSGSHQSSPFRANVAFVQFSLEGFPRHTATSW